MSQKDGNSFLKFPCGCIELLITAIAQPKDSKAHVRERVAGKRLAQKELPHVLHVIWHFAVPSSRDHENDKLFRRQVHPAPFQFQMLGACWEQ